MTSTTIKINVNDLSDYEQPITVVTNGWYEDGELVIDECNHAGAEEEEVDCGGLRHCANGDLDWFDDWKNLLVCDKCNAVYNDLDGSWDRN